MDSKEADKLFSLMIRKRDPICKRCHRRPSTDCSHYWERGHSSTRYDPRNGDGLCRDCHGIWEGRRNGCEEWKRDQLGEKEYADLEQLHYKTMKRDKAISIFIEKHTQHGT